MKKVLFTATVDSHIEHFHLPFLKLFKERGYETHVATNGVASIPYCDVKHQISVTRNPFTIANIIAMKQLRNIIDKEKFDIIHTHTPMGSVVTRLAARKARKLYNTRVLYTAHGFHFFKGAPLLNWLMYYPMEWWLADYTDTLILINEEDYQLALTKFGKRAGQIKLVPGVGVDEATFPDLTDEEKLEFRHSLGLSSDDFVAIYPAELSKRKRQKWLIETLEPLFKKKPDFHLLLPGLDSLNGQCQELAERLGVVNQVHFLGYRKDVKHLLQIADVAVSAAKQEGLPVNLKEAMVLGLPIVATECRGNRDLVTDGVNGYLIDLNDVVGYRNCIESIMKNNHEHFGESSKQMIQEYSVDRVLQMFEEIYFRKN